MGKKFDRAYGVLQTDKRLMDEGSRALMMKDVERKLSEYFELLGEPALEITQRQGKYFITISLCAERIKHFQVLRRQ